MSGVIDDGLSSLKDLFSNSDSDVSVEEVTEVSSGVGSSAPVGDSSDGGRRVVCSTPVKRKDSPKKEVRIVAPRRAQSVRCEARFLHCPGGSLDERESGCRRLRKDSVNSPAGDLEIPVSRTWSNGPRSGRVRVRYGCASSWDDCPMAKVDVDEAIALKGKRNNRAVAEQMVGEYFFVDCGCCVVVFLEL